MEPTKQPEQNITTPNQVSESQNPAPNQPAPAPTNNDPGKTLGIVSLILPFIGLGLIGLIVGIIGKKKSKAAGYSNGLAVAGIIVSVISIIVTILIVGLATVGILQMSKKCQELGPGTHYEGTTTITCGGTSSNLELQSSSPRLDADNF